MNEAELAALRDKQARGTLTTEDTAALLEELPRRRRWLTYAAENATYPYVQMQLNQMLTEDTPIEPDWT